MSVDLVKQSRRLTSALRRVRVHLESSVRETAELNEALTRDGDLIGESHGLHSEQLPTSLASSSRYLSRVKDAARRERRGLLASMTFFSAAVVFVLVRRLRLVLLMPLLQSLVSFLGNQISPISTPRLPKSGVLEDEKARLLNEISELERAMESLNSEQTEAVERVGLGASLQKDADGVIEAESSLAEGELRSVASMPGEAVEPASLLQSLVNEKETMVNEESSPALTQFEAVDTPEDNAPEVPTAAASAVVELELGIVGDPLQAAAQDPA